MSRWRYKVFVTALVLPAISLVVSGCSTAGSTATDIGLAGAGGVAGYKLSDGNLGVTAAGAAAGLIASKVLQAQVKDAVADAERQGFERGLNQAAKQQYWVIQNQQRSHDTTKETTARLIPVTIPESSINGAVQVAHVEYLRVEP